jgi:hypothetical protein
MPDGYECDWYYVDTPPSVMVVLVTEDAQLVLVRQYRHNLKSYQRSRLARPAPNSRWKAGSNAVISRERCRRDATALNFPVLYVLMSDSWACVAC